MYFIYVLQAQKPIKNKYYVGVTSNLFRRLAEHNSIFNTGYTRNNYWKIVYVEGYLSRDIAYDREKKLKQYGAVWQGVMRRVKHSLEGVIIDTKVSDK